MSLYLLAGVGASTGAATPQDHLPSARIRRYPSDMTDAEWQMLAPLVPVGGRVDAWASIDDLLTRCQNDELRGAGDEFGHLVGNERRE